ncbi:N/A [soil metagenome]
MNRVPSPPDQSRADPAAVAAWSGARRILAVRLDNLGDVVMTGPALAAIKQRSPDVRLTLLASPSGAAACAHMPMVDDVIRYEAPWVKRGNGTDPSSRSGDGQQQGSADLDMIETLRRRGFDGAIVFSVCTQSALPAALMLTYAGIPLRAAYARENPYGLLTHWNKDTETVDSGMLHEVERQLASVRGLGYEVTDDRLVFRYGDADAVSMRRKSSNAGVGAGQRYVVFHVGATAESRRYPAEGFHAAARAIEAASGAVPVFVGAESERSVVEAARGAPPIGISLVGQLNLGELAALIDEADAMVCNNSGPAHIAAAQGTPTTVLYALTNPQHTPWRVQSRVLNTDVPCRNCLKSVCPLGHNHCLTLVPPSQIVEATLDLMSSASRARSFATQAARPEVVPFS